MEKRFFLALLLTGAVVVLTPLLFPRPVVPPTTNADSLRAPEARVSSPRDDRATAGVISPRRSASSGVRTSGDAIARAAAETVSVRSARSVLSFSTQGAAPYAVRADSFPALNGGGGPVVLRHGSDPLLRYRVVSANDTIALDSTQFGATTDSSAAGVHTVTFSAKTRSGEARITYTLPRDDYLSTINVRVSGVANPSFLLVDLPTGFDTQEADSAGDLRLLANAVKPTTRGARGTAFSSLDSGEKKFEPGPISWAVAKSKYFLVGILSPVNGPAFAEAHLAGGIRRRKAATNGSATIVIPLQNGVATFELYAGPQSWERLHRIGREFETANPYGGWLQPIVQPFSTIVMRVLLWMKKVVRVDYGWVLVIFGVAVRLLMWPLNQTAMRTSLRMQRIQPELQEVQRKYKSDPQKQQQEIMRVYKEHGMSPFSAFSGCLPALIPMPVLMALFFVFQNTIEFRGVSFLWLRDISLHDPLYILPLFMGVTMFALSWIGMRNMPPNPQSKMISYMLPVMLTVFLLQSAAGLSLYYTVQNLAALPQQWLIANERARAKQSA